MEHGVETTLRQVAIFRLTANVRLAFPAGGEGGPRTQGVVDEVDKHATLLRGHRLLCYIPFSRVTAHCTLQTAH
jgi:hypothetical protein